MNDRVTEELNAHQIKLDTSPNYDEVVNSGAFSQRLRALCEEKYDEDLKQVDVSLAADQAITVLQRANEARNQEKFTLFHSLENLSLKSMVLNQMVIDARYNESDIFKDVLKEFGLVD